MSNNKIYLKRKDNIKFDYLFNKGNLFKEKNFQNYINKNNKNIFINI